MSALRERASANDASVREDRGQGGRVTEPPRVIAKDSRAEQWEELRATQE